MTRKSFRYRSFSQATRDGIKKKNGVKRREKSAAAQLYVTICLRENQRSTDTYTQVLYVHMYASAACIHTYYAIGPSKIPLRKTQPALK